MNYHARRDKEIFITPNMAWTRLQNGTPFFHLGTRARVLPHEFFSDYSFVDYDVQYASSLPDVWTDAHDVSDARMTLLEEPGKGIWRYKPRLCAWSDAQWQEFPITNSFRTSE